MILGMILDLDHSKFMQKEDILDIYEKVHGHYYDHLELFLVLLGLGIAIFGFIIPRMINKNIEKSEKRIENEIDRFDRRINDTIEKKVQSEFDKKISEKTKELESKINNLNVYIDNKVTVSSMISSASRRIEDGNIFEGLFFYLHALNYSYQCKLFKEIKDINYTLEIFISQFKSIEVNSLEIIKTLYNKSLVKSMDLIDENEDIMKETVVKTKEIITEIFVGDNNNINKEDYTEVYDESSEDIENPPQESERD